MPASPASDPPPDARAPDPAGLAQELERARAELRLLRGQLEDLRQQDPATGLPNRSRLLDRVEQAVLLAQRQGHLVALLVIELDQGKLVNHSLAFEASNELLGLVARRLALPLNLGDTLARMGQTLFAVLLPELRDPLEPIRAGEALLEAMRLPFRLERDLHLTVSIGISLCPQDGQDLDALQREAMAALERARAEGGDRLQCTTPTLSAASLERREMQTYLGEAIANGELQLLYQPQYRTDRRMIGVEALIRWDHPVLGVVSPTKFISLAEEDLLIHPLGEWVLRTACRQAMAWQTMGMAPMRMAVNVSALQMGHPQWVDTVARILAETKLPPPCLELELTESALLRNAKSAEGRLGELKALGVRIGIDDFGTGYSSLSYLQRLPIDTLKIDQSFVGGLEPGHPDISSQAIVQTIVSLGRNLGLEIVAEGVETEAQQALLTELGCHAFQGFLLGRPMKAREVSILLEAQRDHPVNSRMAAPGSRAEENSQNSGGSEN
jgi:diguanylate cyclase (GGDEF)-like protein